MLSTFIRQGIRAVSIFSDNKMLAPLLFVIAFLIVTGCGPGIKTVKEDVFYTCSMHPKIMEKHPGNCPVCGMELIPVQKGNTQKQGEIQLSQQQLLLGNIRIDTIGKGAFNNETALTATLTYNQQKLTSVSARVMGRVEKLYHKNIGEYIRKGDPLMELYSEELNIAKQQYLLALERRQLLDSSLINFEQVVLSAKTKLLLWGMSESQVSDLEKGNKAALTTTVYSNESGYITELMTQEGAYINEGGAIVQLADLSTLWAEAQIYSSQLSRFDYNDPVTVQLPETGKRLTGKAEFINPEINPDKRINLLRVTIPNPDNQLKPGMVAYVLLGGGKRDIISLPIDAVIRDSKGASVWVRTGNNIFKNKMVTTGIESASQIEIISGLVPGESVVTRGAYLINSEYIFKNGAAPMAGMKM